MKYCIKLLKVLHKLIYSDIQSKFWNSWKKGNKTNFLRHFETEQVNWLRNETMYLGTVRFSRILPWIDFRSKLKILSPAAHQCFNKYSWFLFSFHYRRSTYFFYHRHVIYLHIWLLKRQWQLKVVDFESMNLLCWKMTKLIRNVKKARTKIHSKL